MAGACVNLLLNLLISTALLSNALSQCEDDLFEFAKEEEEGRPLSALELLAAGAIDEIDTFSSCRDEASNQDLLMSADILEGDIRRSRMLDKAILQQDEATTAEKLVNQNTSAANDVIRWDGWRVPYAISSQFRQPARDRIAEAVAEIQHHSCISFEPRTEADEDYIFLTAVGTGCSADVGKFGGRQTVILASQQCFLGFGQIVHELMHVLGFFHEQARYDRDQYLDVQWQNVDPNMDRNFLRYDYLQSTVLKTPYDYESIMHYPADAFSMNGEPTMVPLVKGVTNMGQRQGLSLIDIYELNVFYEFFECPGDFEKPQFAYNLAGSSDNACGMAEFNATTHQCCGTSIIERDKLFCCGVNAYEKPASGLRHGCCGGTPFFAGSGCCNQVVYNRTTHQCCDDEIQIVTKTGESLDCDGNPLLVNIGFQASADASGSFEDVSRSCRVAKHNQESYESDCKRLEDQCTTAQMCWDCSNKAIGAADTEIESLEKDTDLRCQGAVLKVRLVNESPQVAMIPLLSALSGWHMVTVSASPNLCVCTAAAHANSIHIALETAPKTTNSVMNGRRTESVFTPAFTCGPTAEAVAMKHVSRQAETIKIHAYTRDVVAMTPEMQHVTSHMDTLAIKIQPFMV